MSDELVVKQMSLSASQYVNETSKKTQIVLHGTAGSCRPDYVVQGWEADQVRVATHYVVGGLSSVNDKAWDGVVVQALPEDKWSYHLGLKGALSGNGIHDRSSIGIEICNWSYLVQAKTGEFLNYVNKPIPLAQVTKLDKPYRGYQYYHSITDAQIQAVKKLIQGICSRHGIVLEKGKVYGDVDFAYDPARAATQQITFHTAYRDVGEKYDHAPLPNLVAMLNELHAA